MTLETGDPMAWPHRATVFRLMFGGKPIQEGIRVTSARHDLGKPSSHELNIYKSTASERRGQDLFFGKATCADCHQPPYYTENSMHNLKTERFLNNHSIIGDTYGKNGTRT
ncbi:MAG: hypothetical protein ACREJN_17180 [Nitrospiraceae bacterium]